MFVVVCTNRKPNEHYKVKLDVWKRVLKFRVTIDKYRCFFNNQVIMYDILWTKHASMKVDCTNFAYVFEAFIALD